MKVTIGPYVDRWVSYVHYNYMNNKYDFRWDENNTRYERFLERLEDTLQWIYNHSINLYLDRKQRKVKVKLHNYDTWGMDDTLALIILPMLKQLKETKHGVPMVDNEDVPEHLRQVEQSWEEVNRSDENFERLQAAWEWVLDEMIFAFEMKVKDDWQEQYYGDMVKDEDGHWRMKNTDYEGMKKVQERISNGFRLFGRYYEALWD